MTRTIREEVPHFFLILTGVCVTIKACIVYKIKHFSAFVLDTIRPKAFSLLQGDFKLHKEK